MDKGKSLVLGSYTVQKRLSSTHCQLQGPLTPFDLRQATLFLSQKSLFSSVISVRLWLSMLSYLIRKLCSIRARLWSSKAVAQLGTVTCGTPLIAISSCIGVP